MSTISPNVFATVNATGEDLVTQFTNAAADIDGKSDTGHGHAIADVTDLQTTLDDKVDKVAGKQLSTNDYTTDEQTKLTGIEAGAQVNVPAPVSSVNSQIGAVVLDASDVGADPTGAGAGAVAAHETTYDHDSFLTEAPVTSVNGLTGDVIVSGGSSDVIGIRKLASVDGLADWGLPSGAGLALSVSNVEAEKINGRFPYRLDCTGAAAGTYVPLPIVVTEFEAGSSTGLSLWVKPLTGYTHGYLEAVLYDPSTEEILEPDCSLIRTGAHRHAWKVSLNSASSYQVWLRVTTAGGGQTFSLAFDDLRVAKDLVCGRWIQPWVIHQTSPVRANISNAYTCMMISNTEGVDPSTNGHPRVKTQQSTHVRGQMFGLNRVFNPLATDSLKVLLCSATAVPGTALELAAFAIAGSELQFTGYTTLLYDVWITRTDFDMVVNSGNLLTFVFQITRSQGFFNGNNISILVEAD